MMSVNEGFTSAVSSSKPSSSRNPPPRRGGRGDGRRQDGENVIGLAAMQRTDSYRDLIAWQKGMALARSVYAVSASMAC